MEMEKLKVIAEGMLPNEIIEIEDDEVWVMNYPQTTPNGRGYKILGTQFNPLEDNNQMVEIMEKLLDAFLEVRFRNVDEANIHWCELIHVSDESKDLDCSGKTINEAVCNAAYEYFKDEMVENIT